LSNPGLNRPVRGLDAVLILNDLRRPPQTHEVTRITAHVRCHPARKRATMLAPAGTFHDNLPVFGHLRLWLGNPDLLTALSHRF
ncbi:MAG: hypothetical protein RLZZ226_1914, partial [Pseudomonadota bacterium]